MVKWGLSCKNHLYMGEMFHGRDWLPKASSRHCQNQGAGMQDTKVPWPTQCKSALSVFVTGTLNHGVILVRPWGVVYIFKGWCRFKVLLFPMVQPWELCGTAAALALLAAFVKRWPAMVGSGLVGLRAGRSLQRSCFVDFVQQIMKKHHSEEISPFMA